jgi:hypothetical protein
MNIINVLVIVLLLVLIFLAVRPRPQITVIEEREPNYWGLRKGYPVTWNFDWGGGPGYDRHEILTRRGPYNPGGHRRDPRDYRR